MILSHWISVEFSVDRLNRCVVNYCRVAFDDCDEDVSQLSIDCWGPQRPEWMLRGVLIHPPKNVSSHLEETPRTRRMSAIFLTTIRFKCLIDCRVFFSFTRHITLITSIKHKMIHQKITLHWILDWNYNRNRWIWTKV